ncbi:DUF1918 domain-containing protein [Pengzhenrongella frigida]|uniref:DUF1918 domain-containing protein n=1 Tax=Pengzhenrongella frigida TaxID=1259133 RepID=A0A4Q5N0H0_9MICO|nr:DUF1918 domain-containing protein [Cellulomonas sp. HLT2-17]RYV51525.1 DUF1918 domain-containing protein [Cellulomonas sp. HLT2-17]
MQATIGDRLHVHSRAVGQTGQLAEVIEIHGENGAPPYLVRYENGHEALVFPGPDCTIEHAKHAQQS